MRSQPENVSSIKVETEYVFGRRIVTSRDCIDLCDEIFQRTKSQLNPNTLRRFFGLVKASYPPSQATLTILSKYCGYGSIDEVLATRQEIDTTAPEKIDEKSLLNYFLSMFQIPVVNDSENKVYLSFVQKAIRFIGHNPGLADKFQNLVAKTPHGQKFYFESFVNLDKLNSYYDNGLRYYLNENRSSEGLLFVNSVKIQKFWLNGLRERVLDYGHLLAECRPSSSSSLFLHCRYFMAMLFYNNIALLDTEVLIHAIHRCHSKFAEVKNSDVALLQFEYGVAEALLLTGHYSNAVYFLEEAQKRYTDPELSKYVVSPENLNLLSSIAFYNLDQKSLAEKYFNAIRPSGFFFTAKKFYGILYLQLARELKRKNPKYVELITSLIAETGFERLQRVVH